MREFIQSTPLDLARNYVNKMVAQNTAWNGVFHWANSDPVRLQAVLEKRPPVKDIAERLTNWTHLPLGVLVKTIEYGQKDLMDAFVAHLKSSSESYSSWIFQRFPHARTPTIRRALVRYTSDALKKKDGAFCFEKVLMSHSADWISEIVARTPYAPATPEALCVLLAFLHNCNTIEAKTRATAQKNCAGLLSSLSSADQEIVQTQCRALGFEPSNIFKKFPSAPTQLKEESKEGLSAPDAPPPAPSVPSVLCSAADAKQLFYANTAPLKTIVKCVLPHLTAKKNEPSKMYYTHRNRCGRNIIEEIVHKGCAESLKKIIELNIPLDGKDHSGQNLAYKAASKGRVGLLKILIDAGVDPWEPDNNGYTAFHVCALSYPNVLKVLVQHPSANPNVVNKSGETALFCLFPFWTQWKNCTNALKAVNLLLQLGVDLDRTNTKGETFLDVARARCKSAEAQALYTMVEDTVARFKSHKLALVLDEAVDQKASKNTGRRM